MRGKSRKLHRMNLCVGLEEEEEEELPCIQEKKKKERKRKIERDKLSAKSLVIIKNTKRNKRPEKNYKIARNAFPRVIKNSFLIE